MDAPNKVTCIRCGTLIKGGYYNAPSGPHCPACWENKPAKTIKAETTKALSRLASIGSLVK